MFERYGALYERKKGEFGDGVRYKYIDRKQIIEREYFVRTCMALQGKPHNARSMVERKLFGEDTLKDILNDSTYVNLYFAGVIAHQYLNDIQTNYDKESNNRYGVNQYGNAIRYGKYAVISVLGKKLRSEINIDKEYSKEEITTKVDSILYLWPNFEKEIVRKVENSQYFTTILNEETGEKHIEINFSNYYKGNTLLSDLEYFETVK
jgi:hypothetical protein